MIQNKSLMVTFSNGNSYFIPVSAIINHYASNIVQKVLGKNYDDAKKEAISYFEARPDQLVEYATNGMSFIDVLLVAKEHTLTIAEKDAEWKSRPKLLVENPVTTGSWPKYTVAICVSSDKNDAIIVEPTGFIEIKGKYYWNTRLLNCKGHSVKVEIDPHDDRYIKVFSLENKYICTAGRVNPHTFRHHDSNGISVTIIS